MVRTSMMYPKFGSELYMKEHWIVFLFKFQSMASHNDIIGHNKERLWRTSSTDAGFNDLASVTYLLGAVQLKISWRSRHDGRTLDACFSGAPIAASSITLIARSVGPTRGTAAARRPVERVGIHFRSRGSRESAPRRVIDNIAVGGCGLTWAWRHAAAAAAVVIFIFVSMNEWQSITETLISSKKINQYDNLPMVKCVLH